MRHIKGMGKILGIMAVILMASLATAHGARIKDIADFEGVRDNQLIGYGLVVGLAKTGDNVKNGFTRETLTNMLSRQGLSMRDKDIKSNNVASVMVTASMPPFARVGTKVDVVVSSIGDATSLQGGTLLMTPLRGADGEIYAVAQGAVTLGGHTAGGRNATTVRNHPSVGRIASGAFVERELRYALDTQRTITIQLHQPDFTTAKKMAEVIQTSMTGVHVSQRDGRSVTVALAPETGGNAVDILARIENLQVPVDAPAVVVMNEKTGTVVMGENVRISTVAVSHGNLSIQIRDEREVSQPYPFSGGQTVVTTGRTVTVNEDGHQLMVVPRGVTIQDMVKGLNAIGVTPRDLITILQTIKAAGALQAELRMI